MRNRYQPPTVRVALAAITSATLFLFVNASSVACPFCAKLTRSFADEVRESAVVIHGTLFEPGSDPSTPGTRVRIRSVIKGENLSLGDEISLNETVAAARTKSLDRLIFGHLANGAISPTRLDNVSEQFVDYLLKSTSLKDPSASGRLAFFFTRLDDPDDRISQDAYAEFAKASFRATSLARKHFEPAKLRAWLDDAQTPPDRIGLFGLLLGLCGDQDDADRLSAMCAQPTPTQATGLDGLIGGLILLDSQRGIDRMLAALTGDTSTSGQRLAGLAALAFVMVELTPESSSDILHRASRALGHPDVTAPLIDELRKGRVWDVTDEVLACADSPRDFPAVVRYAMASPAAAAQRFVEHIKREQPMVILEAQQAMEFESANRDLLGPRPAAP